MRRGFSLFTPAFGRSVQLPGSPIECSHVIFLYSYNDCNKEVSTVLVSSWTQRIGFKFENNPCMVYSEEDSFWSTVCSSEGFREWSDGRTFGSKSFEDTENCTEMYKSKHRVL